MGKLVVENGRATGIYAVFEYRTGGFSRRF